MPRRKHRPPAAAATTHGSLLWLLLAGGLIPAHLAFYYYRSQGPALRIDPLAVVPADLSNGILCREMYAAEQLDVAELSSQLDRCGFVYIAPGLVDAAWLADAHTHIEERWSDAEFRRRFTRPVSAGARRVDIVPPFNASTMVAAFDPALFRLLQENLGRRSATAPPPRADADAARCAEWAAQDLCDTDPPYMMEKCTPIIQLPGGASVPDARSRRVAGQATCAVQAQDLCCDLASMPICGSNPRRIAAGRLHCDSPLSGCRDSGGRGQRAAADRRRSMLKRGGLGAKSGPALRRGCGRTQAGVFNA